MGQRPHVGVYWGGRECTFVNGYHGGHVGGSAGEDGVFWRSHF